MAYIHIYIYSVDIFHIKEVRRCLILRAEDDMAQDVVSHCVGRSAISCSTFHFFLSVLLPAILHCVHLCTAGTHPWPLKRKNKHLAAICAHGIHKQGSDQLHKHGPQHPKFRPSLEVSEKQSET